MKNVEGTLILRWKREGVYYQRELKKQYLYDSFERIMKGSSNDNEVSTELVEIVPEVSHLIIDWDTNTTRDTRALAYIIEEVIGILQIKYHHKDVWLILEKYCQDGVKISPEKFMNF